MLNEHGSSSVTVSRSQLLATLKKNRDEHKRTYDAALIGYVQELRTQLQEALEQAHLGVDASSLVRNLEKPLCHLKEYERAIIMIDMSTGNEIELSEGAFRQLVLDEWNWKMKFIEVSGSYSKAR